jgi:signal transduction histidine kinase
MSSRIDSPVVHSAAWRISLWATLAFACGTLFVFIALHRFVANDIQRRSDAWLTGEIEVLGNVAEHTPKDSLYSAVVSEVAELASKEVPNKLRTEGTENGSVFFLQAASNGSLKLWVGYGRGDSYLDVIGKRTIIPAQPTDIHVDGIKIPYRVATLHMEDGSSIYLGLSERDELRVLRNLRSLFILMWLVLVLLGFSIVFYTTRRMLSHVRRITEAASQIGHSDLTARVPTTDRSDEVGHLARTLNHMLDRIESSMHQLHTITDALAHDLRSPLTAIRGKLEMSLSAAPNCDQAESIVSVIDELDRLTDFLNTSLDVAEAKADALRLSKSEIDLDELLRIMIDLYEPSMSDQGISVSIHSSGSALIYADASLIHRMISNLFDNELKHLPPSSRIAVRVEKDTETVTITLEDDGPGFSDDVLPHLFERRIKGKASKGHGLGLAFVEAVVRAHGGSIAANNRDAGGVNIRVQIPVLSA